MLWSLRAAPRRCDGPKHARPAAVNRSAMPRDERALGTDDGQVDVLVRSRIAAEPSMSSAAMSTLRTLGSSAVPALPGATKTSCDPRRLRALPGERVFAAAAADDQDFHPGSVAKVAHAGEHHGDAVLIGGRDDFRIALRAARLNDRVDAELGQGVESVAKRKEGIGGDGGADSASDPRLSAFIAAILLLTTRLIWPAPMPSVALSLARRWRWI